MAISWIRRSAIGSLVIVRYRKRGDLPSGVWSPKIFKPKETPEITPEIREHLTFNTCKTKINFGEFNGTPMGALPTPYLLYLANDFSSEEIHHWRYYRDMAKEVLRERRSLDIIKRKENLQHIINRGKVDEALQILRQNCNQVDLPPGYAQLIGQCAKTKSLEDGRRVHDQIHWAGFSRNSYLGELLIVMYSKCNRLDLSLEVFEKLPRKLVSTWTTMTRCYMEHGRDQEALDLYQKLDVAPDTELLVSMFDCCGNLKNLNEGKIIQACLISSELRPDLRVRTAIFRFFARCGEVAVASNLFVNLEKKSVDTWNVLIQAYVRAGQGEAAMGVYRKMDVAPDADVFVTVLSACSNLGELKSVEADLFKHKLLHHPKVSEAYKRVRKGLEDGLIKC